MTGATTTPTTEASSSKSSCIEDQTTTTCCTESESEAKANANANAARATATATQPPSQSVITLLIENPGKGKNWGPLLRCCAAFGIRTIYVVGYDKCDIRGSHGASKHVTLKAFPTHEQAARALTAASSSAAASNTSTNDEGGFELVGLLSPPLDSDDDDFDEDRKVVREQFFYEPAETEVEIARIAEKGNGGKKAETTGTEQQAQTQIQISFPVHLRNRFPRKTCLVVDKMKRGLPWSLAKHCSSFVHVPHSNFNGSGSMLTLEASVSIVFHEAMNAGLVGHATDEDIADDNDTTNYEGQKYHVETIHKGGHPSDTEARQRKRKEREDKLKVLQDEAEAKHESIFFGDNNTNNVDDGDY